MRSLRSRQKTDVIIVSKSAKTTKSENSNSKMCNKRSKPGKAETRCKRLVLADKTNSDPDTNSSSNISAGLTITRPKRTQNLPVRYQDHDLTPVKSYRPECSSTSLPVNNRLQQKTATSLAKVKTRSSDADLKENNPIQTQTKNRKSKLKTPVKNESTQASENSVTPIYKKGLKKSHNVNKEDTNADKVVTPVYKKKVILLEKPKIQTPDRMALYEFDFDPSEEPTQTKKKGIRKKATTAKKKNLKSDNANDDAALQVLIQRLKRIQEKQKCKKLLEKKKLGNGGTTNVLPIIHVENTAKSVDTNVIQAVDSERQAIEELSPIPRPPSPLSRPPSPLISAPSSPLQNISMGHHNISNPNDSSNRRSSVRRDFPIASSSMIVKSPHKPAGSPWRVEGGAGIRKWPLNFHVKPSMTPSYERDTVHVIGLSSNREQNSVAEQRKHVYTNISINTSHDDDEQTQKKTSNWKQTSILSFYEESLRKSAKKRSLSPKKNVESYNFDDLVPETNELYNSLNESQKTPEKCTSSEKKKADVDNCFGFDDSAEFDQENVSPAKIPKLQNINTIRGTFKAKRTRGILKEMNQLQPHKQNLPMRAIPADVLNTIEKQKFMEDIEEPRKDATMEEFPEININNSDSDDEARDVDESLPLEETHEGEVELFAEPVEPELVHFSKTSRRSYGTRKRGQLSFLQPIVSKKKDNESDYHSDDSSTSVEKVKVKKVMKKKKQTTKAKKEEKQVDEWAAGFNSMLEEVEDFPLCVE